MSTWIEMLDVDSYVQQLMQKETIQIDKATLAKLSQLSSNQSTLKTKISAYGQLQSMFSTLQQKLQKIKTVFNPTFEVGSSNSNIATVAINDKVAPGNHNVTVTQLAQARQVASANVSSSNDALNKTNTLTIGVGTASFNLNVSATDSLQTIANNINTGAAANNVGAFASVVSTSPGQYRLVIASTKTGADNAVNITETGTGSNALNISTGVSGTGTILSEAQNAHFTFDTLNYDVAGNTNSIAGLNINILSLGTSTFSVTETDAVSDVQQAVQGTIDTYNEMMKFIAQTQANTTVPDPILPAIQAALTSFISSSPDLLKLGIVAMPYDQIPVITSTAPNGDSISIHPTGFLTIANDPVTGESFASKLAANFSGVQSQLMGDSGAFTALNNMLKPTTGSIWKTLNDIERGSLPLAQTQLTKINEQINSVKTAGDKQKSSLLMKYAKLNVLLNSMKIKSQYMTQQLSALGNNK